MIDEQEKEAEELHDKLHAAKETDKKRLTRIKASEAHIAKLQHELENPPETEDLEKIMDEFVRSPPSPLVVNPVADALYEYRNG